MSPTTIQTRARRFSQYVFTSALLSLASLFAAPTNAALIGYYNLEQASPGPMIDTAASPENAAETGSGHLYQQAAIPLGAYGDIGLGGSGHGFTAGISASSGEWNMGGSSKYGTLTNDFTVMAWVNPNATTGSQRVIAADVGGQGWAFGLSGNRIRVTGLGVVDSTAPAGDVVAGQWQHIAMTKSSTTGVTFYLNGIDVGTNAGHTANWIATTNAYHLFDGPGTGERFVGLADEIRVYSTVLTRGEILAIAGKVPEPSTLALLGLGFVAIVAGRRRRAVYRTLATLVLVGLCFVAGPANSIAATFYNISSVSSDTSGSDLFVVSNLIEGAGTAFDAAEPHNLIGGSTWVTNAPNGGGGDYFAPTPTPGPRLIFDLGTDRFLGEISIWGYADGNANGVRVFDLQFAREADGLGGFGTSVPYNPTFTISSNLVTPRNSFDFDQPLVARYVELIPTDNFRGFGPPGGDRVGLGEVAFSVFGGVPEPSSALLLGLGLFGLASRRVRRQMARAKTIATLLVVAAILSASTVHAGTITTITPTGVAVNTGSEFFPVGQIIDNSGLSGPPFDPTSTHASSGSNVNSWVTNAPGGGGSDYLAVAGPAVLTFDLGGTFALAEVNVWNYAQSNGGNQARDITLTFSNSGTSGPFSNPVNIQLALDSAGAIDAQSFSFATTAANAVRFTITDNYFGFASGGDRIGLGEVKFGNFVPEPSTFVLFGLGVLGLVCRRSRRAQTNVAVAMVAIACVALSTGTAQAGVSGLVANWALDEPLGTSGAGSVVDSWGALPNNPSYDGTPTGVTFGEPGATVRTGTAALFNGSSEFISVGFDSALNTASFTYTTWARVDGGAAAHRAAVTSRDGAPVGTFRGFILYALPGDTNWSFWTGDDANNQWDVLNSTSPVTSDLVHLAISFDDATNTKSIYVNGVLENSTTSDTYDPMTDPNPLSIGAGGDTGGSFRFNGLLDDAAYFNRALTQEEIQLVMNSNAFRAATIPEPTSIVLLGLGLVGLASRRRRRQS
ncbi:MAG: PEP-CTERM sorting domain-containing protein [Planctomycetales bacterium]|nr:PEP-CTERM sorting domain-containing protein [Planctomycetales bacterium]